MTSHWWVFREGVYVRTKRGRRDGVQVPILLAFKGAGANIWARKQKCLRRVWASGVLTVIFRHLLIERIVSVWLKHQKLQTHDYALYGEHRLPILS
jgi:hypothetical protein